MRPDARTALLLVDVQEGFDDPSWGRRDNPDAEANMKALLHAWKAAEAPVVVVRHDSVEADSTLRPDAPGNALRAFVRDAPADLVVSKAVNSAFHGTAELDPWLRERGIDRVGPEGEVVRAEDLARASAASLHGEFATVVSTADVLAAAHP